MSNKWCTLFEGSRKGVEPQLKGGCSRAPEEASRGGSMVYFVREEDC